MKGQVLHNGGKFETNDNKPATWRKFLHRRLSTRLPMDKPAGR